MQGGQITEPVLTKGKSAVKYIENNTKGINDIRAWRFLKTNFKVNGWKHF